MGSSQEGALDPHRPSQGAPGGDHGPSQDQMLPRPYPWEAAAHGGGEPHFIPAPLYPESPTGHPKDRPLCSVPT